MSSFEYSLPSIQCNYSQYYDISNNTCYECSQTYNSWPWCVRNDSNLCFSGCSNCAGFDYNDCNSCRNSSRSPPECFR